LPYRKFSFSLQRAANFRVVNFPASLLLSVCMQMFADDVRDFLVAWPIRLLNWLSIQTQRRPSGVDFRGGLEGGVHGLLRIQKAKNGPANALGLRQIFPLGKFAKTLKERSWNPNVQRNRVVRCILCVIRVRHESTVLRTCVGVQAKKSVTAI